MKFTVRSEEYGINATITANDIDEARIKILEDIDRCLDIQEV